ncbi:hypothetical protein HZA87_01620 [Candidatus Uhrbacteria bacterium]|nr:hypothetical protein [Candidatus Uhrbacteria bacterium]
MKSAADGAFDGEVKYMETTSHDGGIVATTIEGTYEDSELAWTIEWSDGESVDDARFSFTGEWNNDEMSGECSYGAEFCDEAIDCKFKHD